MKRQHCTIIITWKYVAVSTSLEEFIIATHPWLKDTKSNLEYYASDYRDGPKNAQITIMHIDVKESVITELKK